MDIDIGIGIPSLLEASMNIEPALVASRIEDFIRTQFDKFQRDGVVLGMSGGIDSSLVGTLLVRALGPEKVLALLLPERDSSPQSKTDALKEIDRLGIEYREIDLTPILSAVGSYDLIPLRILGTRRIKEEIVKRQHTSQTKSLGEMPFMAGLLGTKSLGKSQEIIDTGNAYARVKHRARILMLYYVADMENRLVVGTTNKSEAMSGFVVKWGDNVADIEPIINLYKTQVRQLSSYVGVPGEIIDKAPSPDLLPGIVDELALGVDYETMDKILWALEQGWDRNTIISKNNISEDLVAHVQELVNRSWHLRELPPAAAIDG
jgi:NAD+ synthase